MDTCETAALTHEHPLTLSGGAPARDGALAEEGQRRHPEVDGPDKAVEDQRGLQPQQSQVALFGQRVVARRVLDLRDSDQLNGGGVNTSQDLLYTFEHGLEQTN